MDVLCMHTSKLNCKAMRAKLSCKMYTFHPHCSLAEFAYQRTTTMFNRLSTQLWNNTVIMILKFSQLKTFDDKYARLMRGAWSIVKMPDILTSAGKSLQTVWSLSWLVCQCVLIGLFHSALPDESQENRRWLSQLNCNDWYF